ncbi:2-hydroxychromene-2-carboxylate isomerase [Paracoccus sanguinis]|uniref:2-hydroxychromene-2-carboxylate isomerase n=1 Tax=Paracoccus sanguinis TaxID=1545044 RepID=A0A099GC51_9RHOB|nr:2-hydroxychromene-2-carboxylate isomerase [Paracoccus sanguinis]KGJ18740.1 2-hydroxychromene-2-carboxylate isomerase [Paracoccus sanguinis]KGJ20400.1 2-hydroxychromene-2-carboxylate isomerase [Paracoccus sanguinis]SDX42476.1 2-hydroxychromene-2-carboxylate isomerase [Paracoccus sanguinis]
MAAIDYYFSTISPWAYLAGDRLEQIAARHGASITYRPLDMMQLFDRTGGQRPQDRHPARLAYRNQDLPRVAAHLGMPIRLDVPMTNMAPSSYAVIAAQEGGADVGTLVQGLLAARFVEGRDVADDAVIRDVLAATGHDPAIADRGLFTGAEIYGRNLERAVAAGVFGSPFYIVAESGEMFWGQDRLDYLDRHLATL